MTLIPDYRLTVNGELITPKVKGRLIGLTLHDKRGMEADQVDITLDDSDGKLAIPSTGATMSVHIGWRGQALTHCGIFTIDSLEHSGAPDQLTLHGSSANFGASGAIKIQRTRSFHDETIGSLIDWIAGELNLSPAVSETLASRPIAHLDQTNESDANLLTRLAKENGAVAAIKHERLLFIELGHGLTASGKPLPSITITRSKGDRHNWRGEDREGKFTGVKAGYWDKDQAKRVEALSGNEGNVKTLRGGYANKEVAMAAAEAEFNRIKRAGATFELTLARGLPGLSTETPIILNGWRKKQIDRKWIVVSVEHSLTDSGFTSKLTLEPAIG